jgi:nitrogen-specific signal transduction histidine kinase
MHSGLEQIVESLPDGVLLLDRDWRIEYANETGRKLSRIEPQHLQGPTHWELYPETVGTPLEATYRRAMERGEEGRIAAYYYEPFLLWLDVRVMPIESGLALYYRDVTATMTAEAGQRSANDQLEQVLAATTDGVVIIDREWRIAYMNGRAAEILAPSGDVLHTKLWESFPEAYYEGSPYVEHYERAMAGMPGSFEAYYPEPLNCWLQLIVRPSPEGIIVFFRDVTDQKKRDAALIQSEKLAAVGRLASSIAHEINNPLESVTNLIYIARQFAVLPEVKHYLGLADQELRRVSAIANQTLRFHKQASLPREITCAELFETVLSLYEGRLKSSGVRLEKRKRSQRSIECFEGDIRQVLSNLVANAIDAMSQDEQAGRLQLRSRDATDWRPGPGYGRRGMVLTVADSGGGIPETARAHIFEPFYTTKGNQGTGLGLWISAAIVERHNGRMLMRSSNAPEHHGTVFSIFLPHRLGAVSDELA